MNDALKPDDGRPVVLPATTTPFSADGALDLEAAAELFRALAGSGVDGMFVAGTTGEFPALSTEEREALIEAALHSAPDVDVFPHVGAVCEREAVRLTRFAVEHGATRMAAVTPYFYAAANDEIERYYRAVAEAAEGREVYGYSIPSVAKNRIDADLVRRLEDVPNFTGAKVSIAGAEAVRELVDASRGRLRVLCGDDRSALAARAAGSVGMVTGAGTALPQPYVELADAIAADDEARVGRAQELIDAFVEATRGEIPLIKLALKIQGLPGGATRVSLPRPSGEDRRRLEAAIDAILGELGSPTPR